MFPKACQYDAVNEDPIENALHSVEKIENVANVNEIKTRMILQKVKVSVDTDNI